MQHQPAPYPPPAPHPPSGPQRPTSVTVFGILNLVLGGMGIVSMLSALLMVLGTSLLPQNPNIPNPFLEVMQEPGPYRTYILISIPLGFIAAIVLIVAGIGLLKLRPWGRTLSIGYAIFAILSVIVGVVVNFVFLYPELMDRAKEIEGPSRAIYESTAMTTSFSSVFGLIYPVVLLYFMFRPKVVRALQPIGNEPMDRE